MKTTIDTAHHRFMAASDVMTNLYAGISKLCKNQPDRIYADGQLWLRADAVMDLLKEQSAAIRVEREESP